MDRLQLEALSIHELREMGIKAGIVSSKKAQIVAQLATDFRSGTPVQIDVPAMTAPQTQTQPEDSEQIIWAEVPIATSDINGSYVEPPFYGELASAVTIGHVELMGSAGSGQPLAIHHLASGQGRKLAVVTADGGLRKRDLVGTRELIGGRTVFQASEFATAAKNGDWALIDEANMAEPDALGFLNGMLDRPASTGSTFVVGGKAIEVHPDFRCFMTRNPNYQGTKPMNEALRDRFWSINVPPLLGDALEAMLKAHQVKKDYIPDAVALIEALYRAWQGNRISYQVSPRRALSSAKMADLTKKPFRDVLTDSILTKIDVEHERNAVEAVIQTVWRAQNLIDKYTN